MGEKTAIEVMKELEEKKKLKPPVPKRVTVKHLESVWMKELPLHVEKSFHKPLTMKELGMLAHYLKLVKVHAVPAMVWAIANWPKMRYKAENELGITLPTTPVIGSLLRACSVAVEGYLGGQEAGPTVESFKIVHSYAKSDKATEDEIEQALKEMHGE